jgi:hypothetical protein
MDLLFGAREQDERKERYKERTDEPKKIKGAASNLNG